MRREASSRDPSGGPRARQRALWVFEIPDRAEGDLGEDIRRKNPNNMHIFLTFYYLKVPRENKQLPNHYHQNSTYSFYLLREHRTHLRKNPGGLKLMGDLTEIPYIGDLQILYIGDLSDIPYEF